MFTRLLRTPFAAPELRTGIAKPCRTTLRPSALISTRLLSDSASVGTDSSPAASAVQPESRLPNGQSRAPSTSSSRGTDTDGPVRPKRYRRPPKPLDPQAAAQAVATFALNLHLPRLPGETVKQAKRRPVFSSPTERAANATPDALDLNIPELPPLPTAPKYPCPYLTEEEVLTYLVPLYHRGWFIGSSGYLEDGKASVFDAEKQSPQLVKIFHFSSNEAAAEFGLDLKGMQEREKHHASVMLGNGRLQVRIHTHAALPPAEPDDERPANERSKPGLTLRDVRLALLLEGRFDEYLNSSPKRGRHVTQRPAHRVRTEPHTPAEVEGRRHVRTRSTVAEQMCQICKRGVHNPRHCPWRLRKPKSPCLRCGEMHWSWECPLVSLVDPQSEKGRLGRHGSSLFNQAVAKL